MNIETIANEVRTQDNDCTALPIFIVQQRRRIYGFDPQWSDNTVFVDGEGNECEESDPEAIKTAFVDRWDFVTACFTRKGCEDYIQANGHNLTDPRIYVESGYRNREWETLRNYLLSHAA